MAKNSTDVLDEVFGDMNRTFERKQQPPEMKPITVQVPAEYHSKFIELQQKTNREFGRRLKQLVKRSIDKVAG